MNTIRENYHINAFVESVWKAFTTAKMAEQWGAGPATIDANVGGKFSYWDGDIHGVITEIKSKKYLEQDWYEHEYPERYHKVTFTFKALSPDTTQISLVQTNVEDDELTALTEGWREYYFDPIKKLLEKETR